MESAAALLDLSGRTGLVTVAHAPGEASQAAIPVTLRDGEVVTVDSVHVADELQPLYDYLARRGSFVALDNYKPDYLPILSRDVLKRIPTDDESWEAMVPPAVSGLIRKRGFFGFPRER